MTVEGRYQRHSIARTQLDRATANTVAPSKPLNINTMIISVLNSTLLAASLVEAVPEPWASHQSSHLEIATQVVSDSGKMALSPQARTDY
jgi:hypothetical protein